jgi:tRNA(fMet)-specific endonuclease VapC
VKHLLDTNICIAFLTGCDAAVRRKLLGHVPSDLVLCSVVKAELLFGALKSARVDENLRRLEDFFAPFESLPFDDEAAVRYGSIRVQLEHAGQPIGANDMMIAAVAMTHAATLVTRDQGEFRRVPGLRVEAW